MTRKRYQVFLSSTQKDLKLERQIVADRLFKSGFIPVGMEQFPAAAQRALPVVKSFISECDYYVVIVGGMYGSMVEDVSYTEHEYDFAVSSGMPVLAFLIEDVDALPAEGRETSPISKEKLEAFRQRIMDDRVCKFWSSAHELASEIVDGLNYEIVEHPRPGWIRGDSVPPALDQKWQALVEPADGLGITRISLDGNAGDAIRRNIAEARTIRIISTSGVRLIENYKRAFVEALSTECDLRMLVAQADGAFVKDVEETEARQIGEGDTITDEIRRLPMRLRESIREATRPSEAVQAVNRRVRVGYFTTHLRSTMVICDQTWGWITITLPPFRAPETASFELGPLGGQNLLRTCITHFDSIWDMTERGGNVEEI